MPVSWVEIKLDGQTYEEMDTALARLGHCADAHIIADVRATVAYAKAQPFVDPQRIGIVGFCFGGRVAYQAANEVAECTRVRGLPGGERRVGPER